MSDNRVNKPVLEVLGASKSYGHVEVLSDVDFDLYPGEVHALVGENGAGKSTLSKIISGVISKDRGRILMNGEEINPDSPRKAIEHGISIVHQEFNLIPVLSIAQNIFLGREKTLANLFINERIMVENARVIMEMVGLNVSPNKIVSRLSVAQQQMVEIAKCLSYNSKILIMDEPSAPLTVNETKNLFRIIKSLTEKGVAIVYISHKLEEIFEISDRVIVLRDGKKIGTYPTEDLTQNKLISLMVGRDMTCMYGHVNVSSDEAVLRVKNLTIPKVLDNISFELKKGEILGFAGLVGAEKD